MQEQLKSLSHIPLPLSEHLVSFEPNSLNLAVRRQQEKPPDDWGKPAYIATPPGTLLVSLRQMNLGI